MLKEPKIPHWQAALLLCGLVFLAFFGAYSGSPQQPSQGAFADSCEAIAQKDRPAGQNQKGGSGVPPVVPTPQATSPEQSAIQTNEDREIQRRLANYTCQLAIYTAQLASFTRFLVGIGFIAAFFALWQGYELRRSVNLGRDEFNATHRPRIKILSFETTVEGIEEERVALILRYVNRGASTATITEIATKIVTNTDARPLRPGVHMDKTKIEHTTLESGEPEEWLVESDVLLAHHIRHTDPTMPSAGYALRCIGYVEYTDARGAKRRTGFCRRASGDGTQWFREENEDYEYEY